MKSYFLKSALLTIFLLAGTVLPSLYTNIMAQAHNTITKHQLRESIYYLEGRGGNIGVFYTHDTILLVDDQFDFLYHEIVEELKTINQAPVRFVVNTHWHVDHTNGNERFGAAGATIIAHENSAQMMSKTSRIEVFNHTQKPYSSVGLPKRIISDSLKFKLGDETIILQHLPNAHTAGDLIVQFVESNVIHTGDIFVTYGYPFIDAPNGGTIQGVINAIRYLINVSNDDTLFIPGHGTVSNQQDLIEYLDMLVTITSRVELLMNQNMALSQILESHPTRGFSSEKINEEIFVQIIYKNLRNE